MYCLKCRRVTETENITIATSRNGRLMRCGKCITSEKLGLNLLQEYLLVEVFTKNLGEQTPIRNAFART